MRVLCYSPYNRWTVHAQWEMTILQGLKQSGADVEYVLCDGLYSDCDVFWAAHEPRPENACGICQRDVTKIVTELGMDFHWLGRYLELHHEDDARAWVKSLDRDALAGAAYGDYPVADWVRSSVHSHLRSAVLDVSDPAVERSWRSYLYSGLVACFALDRLLAHQQPDVLLQFNGRQSSTRVALELARRRGIRVVTHERGARAETLGFGVNESCSSLQPSRDVWADWGSLPLSGAEIAEVDHHLREREHGRDVPYVAFAPPPQPVFEVRDALGLDPSRPTWALFTSSDDEVVAESAYASPFPTQREWIEQTVAYAAAHPQIQLVIRVHPNTGSRRSIGVNRNQLAQMEAIGADLPANVKMVRAEDEISSYALMDLATVGLVYHSAVGLEMSCRGKHMVIAGGHFLAGTSFVHTVDGPATYDSLLDGLVGLPAGVHDAEVRRMAFRYAYAKFFRLPVFFPLVNTRDNPNYGEMRWVSPEQLRPGLDGGLDRAVGIVRGDFGLHQPPTPHDGARTTDIEDTFFRAQVKGLALLAHADELIADERLLAAFGATFTAADEVSLVIQTPPESTDALVEAIGRAGLGHEDAPDLIAVDGASPATDALYSRRGGGTPAFPRYDDASIASLRVPTAA